MEIDILSAISRLLRFILISMQSVSSAGVIPGTRSLSVGRKPGYDARNDRWNDPYVNNYIMSISATILRDVS